MDNQEISKIEEEDKTDNLIVILVISAILSVIIGVAVFFLHHINYCNISNSSWGTFGDFIGGVAGTIIAFISIRLLAQTLSAQKQANLEISNNNLKTSQVSELQLFNESFKTLLDLYKENLNQYTSGDQTGHEALFKIVHDLKEKGKSVINNSSLSFEDRRNKACEIFVKEFYIKYFNITSVHFRLLYRIYQLIDKSDILDNRKIEMAKIMRCQLPADELLLLRYNAISKYGEKMQSNINTYNLLKHVPFMNLLEMSYLSQKFDETQNNVISTAVNEWSKIIKDLFRRTDKKSHTYEYSKTYSIEININENNTSFEFSILKSKSTDSYQDSDISFILNKLSLEEISSLLNDFVNELFIYSNFMKFNNIRDLQIENVDKSKINNKDKVSVKVTNLNGTDIICSSLQGRNIINTPPTPEKKENSFSFFSFSS